MEKNNMINLTEVYDLMATEPKFYRLLDKVVDSESFLQTIKSEFKKARYQSKQDLLENFLIGDSIIIHEFKVESYKQGRYTNYRLLNPDGTLFLGKLSKALIKKMIKDINIAYAIKASRKED